MDRPFHPVAAIFPLMQGAEFDALVESIRTSGLLNPIWLHPDGSIIDGRNRYRACLEAGVEPRYQKWNGKGSRTDFVVAQNIERRHLNGTQRALLAKKLQPLYAIEAKEKQVAPLKKGKRLPVTQRVGERKKHEGEAAERAARAAKTNRQYVSDLNKIEKEAPKVYAKIEAGEIELPMAKRMMAQVVAEKKLEAAKSMLRPSIEVCDLRVCSMEQLLGEVRNLDLVITDPPDSEKYLPLYGELARLAKTALKPSSPLAVMVGQAHLPEVLDQMRQHMPYQWEIAYLTPGSDARIWDLGVNVRWKPVLLFGRGKRRSTCDFVKGDVGDKRFHEWGQSETGFEQLVNALTEPGQLVCDPFLGAGTTAAACVKLHRRIVGCDIDAAWVDKAKARCALTLAGMAPSARRRESIPAMLSPWINQIHQGECIEVMEQMPEKSIDLIVTSPPYNLRNSTGGGMRNNGGGRWKNCGLLNGYDGLTDDMPHAEYVVWQRRCLTEMMRVLKEDGAIFYNHKPRVQGGLWQHRDEIVAGFPVRQVIIWERAGGINFNPGYFLPTYEVIYLIAKQDFSLTGHANALGDVWHIPQESGNPHPAPFPVALARRCIESTDARVVLDPFIGSGTTAVAAERLGRHWIGIELSQKYCHYADERLARISNVRDADQSATVSLPNAPLAADLDEDPAPSGT